MMGGVNQLKAMFEKTSDCISPDRGRLGASVIGATERSPTPLSKVRTSFIAVQGSGKRSNSTESTKLQKNTLTTEIEKTDESSTLMNKSKSNISKEAELTIPTTLTKAVDKSKQAARDENVKKTSEQEPRVSVDILSKSRMKKKRPSSDRKISSTVSLASTQNGTVSSTSAARNSPKTAINPSTKRSDRKENESNTLRAHKSSRINGDFKSRPSMSNSSITNKTELQASPRNASLKRLPSKSPACQVHLSTSPKILTASSNFKTTRIIPLSTNQQKLKQTSVKTQLPNRSQSRISVVSNYSSASKSQISKRRSGGVSLAEETGKKPLKESITSLPATPEPGFLARMMRPTTSSASKAAEKSVHTARPIKSTTRQTVKNTANDGLSKLEPKKKISTAIKSQNQDTTCIKPTASASKKIIKKQLAESTPIPKEPMENNVSVPPAASKVMLDQNNSKSLEQGSCVSSKEDHPHSDKVINKPATSFEATLQKQGVKVSPSADLEHMKNSSDPILLKLDTITSSDQTSNPQIKVQSSFEIKEKSDVVKNHDMDKIDLNNNRLSDGEVGFAGSLAVQNITETVNTEKKNSDTTEPKSQSTTSFTEPENEVEDKNTDKFKGDEGTALHTEQDKFAEDKLSPLGTMTELQSSENSNDFVEPKQLKSPISSPLTKMKESTSDPDVSLSLESPREIAQNHITAYTDTSSTPSNIIHQQLKDSSVPSSTILIPLPSPSHFDNLELDTLPSPSSVKSLSVETPDEL